jgi:uncharacterized membrane protein
VRLIQARPRLFICIAIGIVLALIQPHDWQLATRLLIAWNGAVILYLILGAHMMMRADKLSIRRRAQLTDDGKYAFLGLSILAAIASFTAIVLELAGVKDLAGSDKAVHVATSSRTMRALALVHGIVSFFFNTTILALTINIAASLL